jgi:hypothetical protein
MFSICPYCSNRIPKHGSCCRVPSDMDRFERVYERLDALHENPFLRENLRRYLVAYGRRSETIHAPRF